MNKIFVGVLGLILAVLIFVVFYVQFVGPQNVTRRESVNLSVPTATPVPVVDNSALMTVTTNSISKLLTAWYTQNKKSYAGFMADPKNIQNLMKLTPNGVTLSFSVLSSKLHYVVRTKEDKLPTVYCIDDRSTSVQTSAFISDSDFRASKDCSGKAL